MKSINNNLYIFYSELSPEQKNLYYYQIRHFLKHLVFEYSGFSKWFSELFFSTYSLKQNREIIICENNFQLAGISILKNDGIEKKICTLRVAKPYQRQGIGRQLMELSFEWLNDDKPLITIHHSKKHEFQPLFKYYNFELDEKKRGYYRLFNTELVYNGSLPDKNLLLNHVELIDLRTQIAQFLSSGGGDLDLFIDKWLHNQWILNQKRNELILNY